MNIAIDILAILGPGSKNRGIGNYTTNQLKKVFEHDKKNRYFLLNFYEDVKLKELLHYSDNVTEHYFYLGEDNFLSKNGEFQQIFGQLIKKFICEHKIDVFYITSPFDGSIKYDFDTLKQTKVVATVYDIIPYLFKEKYLSQKSMHEEYMFNIKNLLKVDKMLAISNSVKSDVVREFNVDSSKIDVIYAGVDESFNCKSLSESQKQNLKDIYGITNEFILCTGGDDERKNIGELIISYSKLPKNLVEKYQLVIACKLSQHSEENYRKMSEKHGVGGRVILTNFVPHEHLVDLYNIAHVFAFPSKYEGFGLPVIEAMACGTPVLTSNNSSLGEIAEGSAVLVDPFDTTDISRGLEELLVKADLEKLMVSGLEKVKDFTWDKVAVSTIYAFESMGVVKEQQHAFRKKLAFFSPLPPLESGISDYSVDIINSLVRYYDIDVFIDDNYKVKCSFNDSIQVFNHSLFLTKKNQYDDVIYQVGNSHYHTYMLEYIRKIPGTIVLHDFNLHGMLHYSAHHKGGIEKYKQYLLEDYDHQTVNSYINDLTQGKSNLREFDMPMNGAVVNYANKVIVHSDYAKKLLLKKNISFTTKRIYHYSKAEDSQHRDHARNKLQISESTIAICAFGHIHETKRIMPVLKAFHLLQEKNNNVRLYLVGKPSPSIASEIEQFLSQTNLGSKVHITGYADLSVFEEYMDASDICLNLRYPYNGETSGSLMRLLGKGKCTLVSDLGSFSEVPNDCCIKLSSANGLTESQEVSEIYEQLCRLTENPELISQIGINARKYAEEHLDLKNISLQYRNFINYSPTPIVTETLLDGLTNYIKHNPVDDIYNLSRTLAYVK